MKLSYVSPDGDVFGGLIGGGGPAIEVDTLTGFVGQFEDTRVQVPGVPGGFVDLRDRVVQPMTGSFTVVVGSREEWLRVRRGFSTSLPGRLELDNDNGAVWSPVRLAVSLPSPGAAPNEGARIPVELVSEAGCWFETHSAPGGVATVENDGDVPIAPTVVWSGAGGRVVLPSGASFSLPDVSGEHRLSLAPENSGRVVAPDGTFSKSVTQQAGAVGERVPIGMQRTYTVPSGARLEWNVGRFDPWI